MSAYTSAQRAYVNYSGSTKQKTKLLQKAENALRAAQSAERARDLAQTKVDRANRVTRQISEADYRRQLREDTQDAIRRGDRSAETIRRASAPPGASVIYNGRRVARKYEETLRRLGIRNMRDAEKRMRDAMQQRRGGMPFGRRTSTPGNATTSRRGG